MLVKVCGLKYEPNIRSVLQMKPDFAGFNFYPQSPRFVNDETLHALQNIDFGETKKVGVFVNEKLEKILSAVREYNLQAVQLHGNESIEEVKEIRKHLSVIKAIGIETKEDIELAEQYDGHCDYILLDKKSSSYGGTGNSFDWKLLEHYTSSVPFFLAGGISPENISMVKRIQHPKFSGIDLNSGFEDSPGIKNIEKLKSAFAIMI